MSGLFKTVGNLLGSIDGTINAAATIGSSYMGSWKEKRDIDVAKQRFENDIEWMKLGQAIQSTSFDQDAIALAKERYGK